MKPTRYAIRHSTTVFVLMGIIVSFGLYSYATLPREAAPDIEFPFIMVVTPYFGVAPEDIETLVTRPIERELKDLKNVKEMRSTSAQGASMISVEFTPDEEISDALQKVREKVDLAKPDLPEDAEDPMVNEVSFSDFPIITVIIAGDLDITRLEEIGEDLQDKIEQVKGVLEVKRRE